MIAVTRPYLASLGADLTSEAKLLKDTRSKSYADPKDSNNSNNSPERKQLPSAIFAGLKKVVA